MAIPVHLQQFKAAGIYRIVWDKSTISNSDTSMIRLVVGYSEKGPFNIPVYVKDTADFIARFGGISKKLEKRGVFFHRMALEMLKVAPILCLNLKKFSGETVDAATISTDFNPNFDPIDSVKLKIEDVYTTTRFWELDAQKLNDLTTATGGKMSQYINISQTSEKADSVTYFIRKASGNKVSSYNVTVNDWFSDEPDNLPEYLENRKGDLISDYFAEIYVFKGKFESAQVLSSTTLKNYFDVEKNPITGEYDLKLKRFYLNAFGESQDTLDALYSDSTSNPIGHYVGALIPNFTDKQGVYASLDVNFNSDQAAHHLMMSFNEDLLEEGLADINLSGRDAIIADSCMDARLINAETAVTLDKIYYGVEEVQTDEQGQPLVYASDDEAAVYNATLPGAVQYTATRPTWTDVDAAKYNSNLPGAKKLGDTNIMIGFGENDIEPDAYNAELTGAITSIPTTIRWTEADAAIYNAKAAEMGVAEVAVGDIKFVIDTVEKQSAYNASLPGAKHEGDIAYDFTTYKGVNAYNETLSGAVKPGDPKDSTVHWTTYTAGKYNASLTGAKALGDTVTYTEEQAKAYNANLTGAKQVGDDPLTWDVDSVHQFNTKAVKMHIANTTVNYDATVEHIDWAGAGQYYEFEVATDETTGTHTLNIKEVPDAETQSFVMSTIDNKEDHAARMLAALQALFEGDNNALDTEYVTTNTVKFNFDTVEAADAYNATLPGALKVGDTKVLNTQADVNAYNATLDGAKHADVSIDVTDRADVNAYNSTLYGAAKAGDTVVYLVPVSTKLLGNTNSPIIAETVTISNSLFNANNELFYKYAYNGKNSSNASVSGSFYVYDISLDVQNKQFSANPVAKFAEVGQGENGGHTFTVEFDPELVVYVHGKKYVKFLKDCGVYVEVVSELGKKEYELDKKLTTTYVDGSVPYVEIEDALDPAKTQITFKNSILKQFISSVYRLTIKDVNNYVFSDPKGIATATVNDVAYTTKVNVLHETNNDNVKNNVYGSSLSFIYIQNTGWTKKTDVVINGVSCDVLASEDDSLQQILSVGDYLLANDGAIDVNDDGLLDARDKDSYYDVVQVQEMGTYTEDGTTMYYIKLTGMPKFYTPGQGDGDIYIIKYNGALNQEIGTMKPQYLEGYTFANSRPTGVSMYAKLQWQNDILSTLTAYRGLRTALLNKSEIDYRYVIDTFESFPSEALKVELAALCKEKQSAFCIANFPSVKSFVKCPYTSFTDEDGNFNVQYVVDGMNKKKPASIKFSLPSDFDGASFIAFYSPLKFSDGYIDNIVPSAAHVSNLFVEKYMSRQPYYIVAGPNYGVISAAGLVGPDYRYSRDELQIIEPYGVNVMVYRPNFGTFINANQTAKQTPVSALSKVHVRELVIYIQDEIEKVLQQYQWEFNNVRTRNAILDKANSICELVMANGGLQAYKNIMDETNNTPEIIDNEMAVISTHIEPGMGCGKMVQELTLYRSGKMSAALSE